MIDHSIFLQRGLNLIGKRTALPCHQSVLIYSIEDFGGLSERRHRKEVRGNKKLEGRGVIGRTERRGYEPARLYRIAHTIAAFRVELPVGHTCESI